MCLSIALPISFPYRPYEVIAISNDTGFIETVPDAVSLDSIKKALPSSTTTLLQYFCTVWGQGAALWTNCALWNLIDEGP